YGMAVVMYQGVFGSGTEVTSSPHVHLLKSKRPPYRRRPSSDGKVDGNVQKPLSTGYDKPGEPGSGIAMQAEGALIAVEYTATRRRAVQSSLP
ncbi:MAG: hypothetical protein ACRDJF_12395, partial [Actinomycetota bacterium]